MAAPLVSFGGIASGLDTQSIIAALSAVNQKPIGLLEKKKAEFGSLKKRYEELDAKLEALRDKARELAKTQKLLAYNATSSKDDVLTASATGGAATGAFNVTVGALARAQVDASNGYADIDTTSAGTGNIKITIDGTQHTISIASGKDTLEGIRDKINDADIGVTATIVSSGSGTTPYQIVLQSDETGTAKSFTTDMTGFTGTLAFTNQQTAQNAAVTVNGMTFSRQTNTISDIVPGITLNLVSTSATPVSVSVTPDFDDIAKRLEEYAAAHSEVVNYINANIKVAGDKGGPFNGESTVRNMKSRLLNALGDGGYPGGSLKSLASIGIKLQNDGTLSFDSEKFKEVALDKLDDISKLMTKVGSKFDAIGFSLAVKPPNAPTGDHDVIITQAATKATGTAGNAFASGGTLTSDELLTFTIGTKTLAVQLASGDDIAAAITKINDSLDDADVDLEVTDDAGSLKFTATKYGSAASFSVVSDQPAGMGSSGVDFAGASGTGLDAAGTIEGIALVGEGQTLKGATTSVYKGLQFKYSGTTAATSTLTLGADGYFVKLEDTLDEFLAAITGPVATRVDGLDDRIDDIDKRIKDLEERAERTEDVMRRRFTALEEIMGRFQAQQNFLATFSFPKPST